MKFMRQLGIILFVTCLGEILKYYLPLPVPASIYGLCLMLLLLMTNIVRLEQVKETGIFLIEIMPLMFIVPAVGIVTSWSELRPMIVSAVIITLISTVAVMAVAGRVTQGLLKHKEDKEEKEEEQWNN